MLYITTFLHMESRIQINIDLYEKMILTKLNGIEQQSKTEKEYNDA